MRFATGETAPIDMYKLMTGLVVPRPIGWIGSYSDSSADSLAIGADDSSADSLAIGADDSSADSLAIGADDSSADSARVANLAPYSFFQAVSGNPPTIIVSSGVRPNRKDTHANLEDRGEFTVNIVTEALGPAMNETAADLSPGESEFALTGLTPVPATTVDAPMVAECPAVFECRVTERVEVGHPGQPPSNIVFFGQVEVIHVDDEILDGTRIRHDVLKPIGRLAGNGYSTVAGSMYDLIRPDR